MSGSTTYNVQIPTDPTEWGVLLICAAAVIGMLTADQLAAVTAVFGFASAIAPLLIAGRR